MKPVRTRVRVPKGITASDLLARKIRQPKWVIDELVKPGLILFAGSGKLGKTKLMLELATAVATGTAALNNLATNKGSVIFLALEDSRARLASRLTQLCDGRPAPEHLKFFLDFPKLDDRGIEKLDNLIQAQELKTRLVVIDTLALARPAASSAGYQQDYSFARKLQRLAHRRRVGLVAITHLVKNSHKDYASEVQGSLGAFASADTLLHLSRPRGAVRASLKRLSREAGELDIALEFSETGQWRLAPEVEDEWLSPERKAIKAALAVKSPMGPKEVSQVTGLPYGSVRVVTSKMARLGQLQRVIGGYQLPQVSVSNVHPVNTAGEVDAKHAESPAVIEDGLGRVLSFADFLNSTDEPEGQAH